MLVMLTDSLAFFFVRKLIDWLNSFSVSSFTLNVKVYAESGIRPTTISLPFPDTSILAEVLLLMRVKLVIGALLAPENAKLALFQEVSVTLKLVIEILLLEVVKFCVELTLPSAFDAVIVAVYALPALRPLTMKVFPDISITLPSILNLSEE